MWCNLAIDLKTEEKSNELLQEIIVLVPLSIHYLDDFLFIEEPGQRSLALQKAYNLLTALGVVPTNPQRVEGLATTLTILGIKLDIWTLTACLSTVNLKRLLASLQLWGDCKHCSNSKKLSVTVPTMPSFWMDPSSSPSSGREQAWFFTSTVLRRDC